MSDRPSNSSLFDAEWRRGLKDLQGVVLNPWPIGPVAVHEEQGTIGSPTSQMVTDQVRTNEQYQAELDRYAARARGREEPEQGIER